MDLQRQLEAEERERKLEEERKQILLQKSEEKKKRIESELELWAEEKLKQRKKEEERIRIAIMAQEEEKKKKQELGHKAFLEWEKNQRERIQKQKPLNAEFYPHQTPWVPIVQPSVPMSQPSKKGGKEREILLSPPHLYNEYSFYEKTVPDYIRKYPTQVASGGRPPSAPALGGNVGKSKSSGKSSQKKSSSSSITSYKMLHPRAFK
jgi:hypothetical protein